MNDSVGYGLVQWTYWSRKKALYNYAKSNNKSIGDCKMQLEFMVSEMAGYLGLVDIIRNASNIREPSDFIIVNYERPANQSESVKVSRASFGQKYFDKYASKVNSTPVQNTTPVITQPTEKKYSVGDIVDFTGTRHYTRSSGFGIGCGCKPGKAKITIINPKGKHPYHLVRVKGQGSTVYGWVDPGTFN